MVTATRGSTRHRRGVVVAVLFLAVATGRTPGWAQSTAGGGGNAPRAYQEPLRPQFHWSPRTDFTNDPNGLVFYKGEYHLFYQARQFSDMGNPEWGHAVSTDLVHWTQLPIAIPKVHGAAEGLGQRICSGSVVVDWNNTSGFGTANNRPLVAAYTDPCIDGANAWQAQSIAYSLDKGRTWTKYAGNPVLDIKARGFRDPKVIWYEPTKRWLAAIAHPDHGVVALYSSPNLKEWTHVSDFASGGAECPDLFPMKVEGTGETKWVMMVASGNYWVGGFDGTTFTPDAGTAPRGRLDYGSNYYAAQTFSDAPNGRRLLLAWMSDGFSRTGIWTQMPWQSGYTVVRELSLKVVDGVPQVVVQPVPEMNRLRGDRYGVKERAIAANTSQALEPRATGRELDIELTLVPGSAAQAGLKVLVGSGQETVVGYDSAANQVYIDRSRSDGLGAGGARGGRGGPAGGPGGRGGGLRATLPDSVRGQPVTLRVLVDRSAVEVFADGGSRAMGLHVFPIQSHTLAAPAVPGDVNLKLSGVGGLTVGGRLIVNSGPNGPRGPAESVTVSSIGPAAVDTSLAAAAAAGDTNVKVGSVANIASGRNVTIDSGSRAETVEVAAPGTAASNPTILLSAASAGDRNIKVANALGFTEGSMVAIGAGENLEVRAVAVGGVGGAGRALALAAPAEAGATNIKLTSVIGLQIGAPVVVGEGANAETRVVSGPADSTGVFNGTPGAAGSGATLSAPLRKAKANRAAVRYLGTGITLTASLRDEHADGSAVRGLGVGVSLRLPLRDAHPVDAAVRDLGSGVDVRPAIRNAWPLGTVVSNEPGGGVEIFAAGGSATVKSLDVWRMRSAW
jgi:fructan beta-fructosidase